MYACCIYEDVILVLENFHRVLLTVPTFFVFCFVFCSPFFFSCFPRLSLILYDGVRTAVSTRYGGIFALFLAAFFFGFCALLHFFWRVFSVVYGEDYHLFTTFLILRVLNKNTTTKETRLTRLQYEDLPEKKSSDSSFTADHTILYHRNRNPRWTQNHVPPNVCVPCLVPVVLQPNVSKKIQLFRYKPKKKTLPGQKIVQLEKRI